jgi:archaellum component FlaC
MTNTFSSDKEFLFQRIDGTDCWFNKNQYDANELQQIDNKIAKLKQELQGNVDEEGRQTRKKRDVEESIDNGELSENEEEINNELDALSDQIGKVNYNRPSMDYRLEKLEGKRKDFLDAIAYVTKEEIPSMEQLYKSEGIHEVNIAFIQNGLDTIEDNEKEAIIKGLEGKRDQPRVVQKPKALNPVSEEDKEYLRWYLTWCRENKQVHSTCPDWNNELFTKK